MKTAEQMAALDYLEREKKRILAGLADDGADDMSTDVAELDAYADKVEQATETGRYASSLEVPVPKPPAPPTARFPDIPAPGSDNASKSSLSRDEEERVRRLLARGVR